MGYSPWGRKESARLSYFTYPVPLPAEYFFAYSSCLECCVWGGLYLLQGIFPIQGSNPGLLHCRQILYQMSYQGSRGIRKEMATHCSILVREIPWTEESGVLQSMRS